MNTGNGYYGYSKSNNALYAESCDIYPATKIAKLTKTNSRWVKDTFTPCEWHHCSKYYNEVDYYSLDEVRSFIEKNPSNYKDWKAVNKKKKASELTWKHCVKVCWEEWTKDGKYWIKEDIYHHDVYVCKDTGTCETYIRLGKSVRSEIIKKRKHVFCWSYHELSPAEKWKYVYEKSDEETKAKMLKAKEERQAKKAQKEKERAIKEQAKQEKYLLKWRKDMKKARRLFLEKYGDGSFKIQDEWTTFWAVFKNGKVVAYKIIDHDKAQEASYREEQKAILGKLGTVRTVKLTPRSLYWKDPSLDYAWVKICFEKSAGETWKEYNKTRDDLMQML